MINFDMNYINSKLKVKKIIWSNKGSEELRIWYIYLESVNNIYLLVTYKNFRHIYPIEY
jgi:hypothetical protein